MIAQDKLDARRKIRGPIYPELKKGSIVLRDLRLWYVTPHRSPTPSWITVLTITSRHAGMPNPTQETRIMLAIVYYAA
jgi:hypothetical protein